MSLTTSDLGSRYEKIRSLFTTLASGAEPTLIAVSKGQPVEAIARLYELGHRDFGENYAQELFAKAAGLPNDIRWHFIGRIQSNKIARVLEFAACIHTVDSLAHAGAIAKAAIKCSKIPFPVFFSVNAAEEPQKAGVMPADLADLVARVQQAYPDLDVRGIMAIPPASYNDTAYPDIIPSLYKQLAKIAKSIGRSELSLGMSGDLRLALAVGATHVRIGTALFGPRSYL